MEKMMIDCKYFGEPCYEPKELCTMNSHGEVDDVILCAEHCGNLKGACDKCAIQKCFDRLAEYEEIGLTPEQIREVDKLYAEKCKEVAELKKYTFTGIEMAQIAVNMQKLREYQELEEKGLLLRMSHEAAGDIEPDIEKCMISIECAINEHVERDNTFTVSVLQRSYKLVKELEKYRAIGTIEECKEAMEKQQA